MYIITVNMHYGKGIKQGKGNKNINGECVAKFNRVVDVDFIKKMMFEQRFKGDEGAKPAEIQWKITERDFLRLPRMS
jgi:hypothetical protein